MDGVLASGRLFEDVWSLPNALEMRSAALGDSIELSECLLRAPSELSEPSRTPLRRKKHAVRI